MDAISSKRRYRFANCLSLPYPAMGPAVYAILNRNNGKIYVGSSVRVNHRMTEHRCSLADNSHGNAYLQRAFQKSPEDFCVEIIEQCPKCSTEELLKKEQFWMDFYRSCVPENGYNIAPQSGSCKGVKHTPESIARMSKFRKRKWSEEQKRIAREKRALHQPRGWKWSKEACQRQSERRKGVKLKPISESHRLRLKLFHQKPILQFSAAGNFIRRFPSILDAEAFFGGNRTAIGDALKGRTRQALGFVWKYASQTKETDICPMRPRKPRGDHRVK